LILIASGVPERGSMSTSQPGQICTSHIERSNLTIRMQNRRWTRLTNAFSKEWENHVLTFALFVAWYNFGRTHMTLKTTPAVAAGLALGTWLMERLLRESAKAQGALRCLRTRKRSESTIPASGMLFSF
jgi:hypothetical protein